MAKIKRQRKLSTDEDIVSLDDDFSSLPGPFKFLANLLRPRIGNTIIKLDALDLVLYVGIFFVTLVVPFLYSRHTTENFLTPKEFTAKISLSFLGALLFLRFFLAEKIQMAKTKLDLPIFLFFLLSLISVAWNYNIPSAVRDLRGTFLIMMLVPLIFNTVKSRWQFEGILWAILLAGLATATLGIMEAYNLYFRWDAASGWWVFAQDEIFSGKIDYNGYYIPLFPQLATQGFSMMSIVSTFGNRNYLGTFVMLTAFIPLSFYFYYKNYFMKGLSLALYAVMLYGLYISRCRAALIGITCALLFMFFCVLIFDKSWKFVKRNSFFFIAVVGIFFMLFLFAVRSSKSTDILDKIKYSFTMERSKSNTYERVWVWYATYQNFAHNPFKWVLGSGYGAFKHFFPLQEGDTFSDENKETFTPVTFRQAHNDWLQLVSELGLIGFGIFIFLCWRYYYGIFAAINRDIKDPASGGFGGDHVLLIGLGAAMLTQLVAAVLDFPFHRIETALYSVVLLALVPVFAETNFFKKPLETKTLDLGDKSLVGGITLLVLVSGILGIVFELRCWKADTLVRLSEAMITGQSSAEMILEAEKNLQTAVRMDPLPGDPYLKLSTISEMKGQADEAMQYATKAWKNINFNARSTYHSVIFRWMHIMYHIAKKPQEALKYAFEGQKLTAGEARSMYYFYIGNIALELGLLDKAEWALRRAVKFSAFGVQSGAKLAAVLASLQKWQDALMVAASVSAQIGNNDPTQLDIIGVAASNLGQNATAEAALRRAIELNPVQSIYKRDLGVVLLRSGKMQDARKNLEESFAGQDTPPQIKNEVQALLASMSVHQRDIGVTLLQQGKPQEAAAVLMEVYNAKVAPPNVKDEVTKILAELLKKKGENATAAMTPVPPPDASAVIPVVPPSIIASSVTPPIGIPVTPPPLLVSPSNVIQQAPAIPPK